MICNKTTESATGHNVQQSAAICNRTSRSALICWDLPQSAGTSCNKPQAIKICSDLLGSAMICCWDLPKTTESATGCNVLLSAAICDRPLRSAQICWDLPQLAGICRRQQKQILVACGRFWQSAAHPCILLHHQWQLQHVLVANGGMLAAAVDPRILHWILAVCCSSQLKNAEHCSLWQILEVFLADPAKFEQISMTCGKLQQIAECCCLWQILLSHGRHQQIVEDSGRFKQILMACGGKLQHIAECCGTWQILLFCTGFQQIAADPGRFKQERKKKKTQRPKNSVFLHRVLKTLEETSAQDNPRSEEKTWIVMVASTDVAHSIGESSRNVPS